MAGGTAPARSVLVTRPVLDSRTRALLEARGYNPVAAPLLTVERFAIAVPAGIQAILVTSGNALEALPQTSLPVLTVGDATAERARAAGFAPVLSAAGNAAALAGLALRTIDPAAGALLLASGAGQGHALAADLRACGFRVVRRVCYAARPVRRFPQAAADALGAGELHAALFLSAETAAAFVRLLPPGLHGSLGGVAALAIGEAAAAALEPLPWLRVCRARAPTLDDVLALI